jgi:chorismate mutase
MPRVTAQWKLKTLRRKIDRVDARLLAGLAKRLDLAKAAALIKKRGDLPKRDLKREKEILKKAAVLARLRGVPPGCAARFIRFLLTESHRTQRQIP